MSTEDPRLLEILARLDARAARLEEGFQLLIELTQNHAGQLDTQRDWINQLGEAQAESTQKIAALADAQIKTEDALRDLGTRTDERINALLDAIERHTADGHGGHG